MMQCSKINLTTIFLGIIALMLSIIVIYITVGLAIANNMTKGELTLEVVSPETEDTVFILEH